MLVIFRTDPNRTQFYCNKSTLFWCHGRLVYPGGSCKKCRYFRPICIICDSRDVYILILLLPLFVFYKLLKRCFKKYILDYSRNVQIFHKFGTLKTRIHHHSDNINARNSQKMSLDWGNIFISLHPPQNFATLALSEGNLHQDPTGTHRHFPLSWKSSLRIAQTLSQLILHLLPLSHWDRKNCSQKLHISLQFIEYATFLPGLLHWTQLQSSLSSHRFCYVPIKSQHVRRTHHDGTFASIYTKPGRASPAVSIDAVAIEDFCVDCFTEEHEVESMPFLLFFACVRVERQSVRFLVCFLLPRDEPVLTLGSFYSQRRSCNKIYKYYWLKFILQAIRQNQTKRIKAKTTNSGDLLSQNQSKIEKQLDQIKSKVEWSIPNFNQ